MNRKILIPIITIPILILIFIGWNINTYSKTDLPYPEKPTTDNPSYCVQSFANELVKMRNAWNANLDLLTKQQKPSSEMVDEAFESMRTYRCWLDYLCEGVGFSSVATLSVMQEEEAKGMPFGANLGTKPGCVSGDKVVIPGTKLKFLPSCHIPETNAGRIMEAETNYRECRNLVQMEFADPANVTSTGQLSSDEVKRIKGQSTGMIALEAALKNNSASQKGMILQDKLQSILLKMKGMEGHIDLLKEYMTRFDSKLSCVAPKCD